ncbi:MAG: pyridoxal phosphate-dependent aminotransferase [Flavobacteriales bacterium]
MNSVFDHSQVRMDLLRQRAFNLRWAAVEEGVIPLTAADPDFPCAPEISDAIARYVNDRYLSYAPAEGMLFFREAMAHYYSTVKGVSVEANAVMACDSAAFGIMAVCKALLQKGDEAIVFNPVDFLFKHCVESVGASAALWDMPLTPDATPDFNQLEAIISSNTKLICLCNPLNPTGKVFTRQELERIAIIAEKHNLIVLSDEIWSDIVFEPNTYVSMASIAAAARRTIVVTGFSKSYGLAGLRAGAVLSPNALLLEMVLEASDQRSTVHGCNVIAQVAATAALNEAQPWLAHFKKHLHIMRDFTVDALNTLPGVRCHAPQGCYVAFADITQTGRTASEIQEIWLREARVSVVPGLPKWFGSKADGHIRISFATSHDILKQAFDRITHCMQS